MLIFSFFSDIIGLPNKLNIFERGISLSRGNYTFFAALCAFLEFGKIANSAKVFSAGILYPRSFFTCLATIGVCVFGALASLDVP